MNTILYADITVLFNPLLYLLNQKLFAFQGNNPATDLRGVGFLGLIQPLYFVMTPELLGLARAIYKLSLSDKQDFPLMVLSINVTRIALHALRDDLFARQNLCNNIEWSSCYQKLQPCNILSHVRQEMILLFFD